MYLSQNELRDFLEEKLEYYNQPWFIEEDPISVPHQFTKREDIEIAGFLSATLAWGKRSVAVQNIRKLMQMMDLFPFDFVMQASDKEYHSLDQFVHRTFNSTDLICFLKAFQYLYSKHNSLEEVFFPLNIDNHTIKDSIIRFRTAFFEIPHPERSRKHIADPEKNASTIGTSRFSGQAGINLPK